MLYTNIEKGTVLLLSMFIPMFTLFFWCNFKYKQNSDREMSIRADFFEDFELLTSKNL